MSGSIVGKKSFEFAVNIIKFYKIFIVDKRNMFYPNSYYAQEHPLVPI